MNAENQALIVNDYRSSSREVETVQAGPVTPMQMLELAVKQGAGLDRLQQLMDLQERWEASQARKAYNDAFSKFKAEAVRIIKNRTVTDGPLKGKSYAELFAVVNAVTPALSANGLSASWKITKDEPTWIEVTCFITHIGGHVESVSMGGPPDVGGAKSAIQARASTVSYLERYTLKAITGLSEQNDDTDGRDTTVYITANQVADLEALLTEVGANKTKFLQYLRVGALTDLPAKDYGLAVQALQNKRNAS